MFKRLMKRIRGSFLLKYSLVILALVTAVNAVQLAVAWLVFGRYVLNATTYVTTDRRGRTVTALTPAERPTQAHLGDHRRKDGQRLDHLANFYLQAPSGFWRVKSEICWEFWWRGQALSGSHRGRRRPRSSPTSSKGPGSSPGTSP